MINSLIVNNNLCNLKDVLKYVIKLKILNTAKKYICFILTDRLFDSYCKNELKDFVN